jgi:hypothetical protein
MYLLSEWINVMNETTGYLKSASMTWEILRLMYNLVLLLVFFTMPWDVPYVMAEKSVLTYGEAILLCLACANACYCLGPLLDLYAFVFLNRRMRQIRYVLFAAGLFISAYMMAGTYIYG